MKSESEEIIKRYERRAKQRLSYPIQHPGILLADQERERAMLSTLSEHFTGPWDNIRVLEIGCGGGGNLLNFIRYGFSPNLIVGNELIPSRVEAARKLLPAECNIFSGDALALEINHGSFDIVFQSMVFTSILSMDFRRELAKKMWSWVAPGGGVLWYDFTYDNPKNPDVKGVPLSEVKQLFPGGKVSYDRITLAPPIARRAANLHPFFYHLLNCTPLLRTHVLCWVEKIIK
tara:strand:+ start:3784 stop:4479 length:696 start_codon:yes stop_codon:yes gene_type:complete